MLRPWGYLPYPSAPWRMVELLTANYPVGEDGLAAACYGPPTVQERAAHLDFLLMSPSTFHSNFTLIATQPMNEFIGQ